MVLAEAVDVEADPLRRLHLLEDLAEAVPVAGGLG
jgi:hypothetical protein